MALSFFMTAGVIWFYCLTERFGDRLSSRVYPSDLTCKLWRYWSFTQVGKLVGGGCWGLGLLSLALEV